MILIRVSIMSNLLACSFFDAHISLFQVRQVLKLLENPYSDNVELEPKESRAAEASCSFEELQFTYDCKPPGWSQELRVTWSS